MQTPITCDNPTCDKEVGYYLANVDGTQSADVYYEDDVIHGVNGVYCSEECLATDPEESDEDWEDDDEQEEDFPDEDLPEMPENKISDPRD